MASDAFDFLRQEGFKIVEMNDSLVRYENNQRFVMIFHGRSSYERGAAKFLNGLANATHSVPRPISSPCGQADCERELMKHGGDVVWKRW